MSEKAYKVGYLLRSSITGFVAGTKVTEDEAPTFGALVKAPFGGKIWIYGLIYQMNVDDDGAVMQVATTDAIAEAVIADNRKNRTVPLEISVLTIGHSRDGKVSHLLPPRAPLSLDVVWQCTKEEIEAFTSAGKFGYFRHILRDPQLPAAELLAAHVQQAGAGRADWRQSATQEIIALLRDDYQVLMQVLSALGDAAEAK
jgi:hypothetical protein